MFSNLALISVMILSLLLLVNCVDAHKDNILTTLNADTKEVSQVEKRIVAKEEDVVKKETVLKIEPTSKIESVAKKVPIKSESTEKELLQEASIQKELVKKESVTKIENKPKKIVVQKEKETMKIEKSKDKKVVAPQMQTDLSELEKAILEEVKKMKKD